MTEMRLPEAWQPIATAPRDGTWFMTYSPDREPSYRFDVAVFEEDAWCKVCCGFDRVTHWCPLLPDPVT